MRHEPDVGACPFPKPLLGLLSSSQLLLSTRLGYSSVITLFPDLHKLYTTYHMRGGGENKCLMGEEKRATTTGSPGKRRCATRNLQHSKQAPPFQAAAYLMHSAGEDT
jgi:hypothetical protein